MTDSAHAVTGRCRLGWLPLFDVPQAAHQGLVTARLAGCLLSPAQPHFGVLQQAGGCTVGQLKPENMSFPPPPLRQF